MVHVEGRRRRYEYSRTHVEKGRRLRSTNVNFDLMVHIQQYHHFHLEVGKGFVGTVFQNSFPMYSRIQQDA